jgi:PncC family amidohydrolase
MLSYFWTEKKKQIEKSDLDVSVSVAESITAGAVANSLCSEPGASNYFKGGVVAYSIDSKKEILKIDMDYAERNNHANPFTTLEMAKAIVRMFKSRIGIATTGYSLPYHREENKEKHECALSIEHPYAYITLFDSYTNYEITVKQEFVYNPQLTKSFQRANVQALVALKATNMYNEYVKKIQKPQIEI